LARRATFYEQSQADADFRLIVDAGAFSRGVGEIGRIRSEYMVLGLDMLGYDVVNFAVQDLNNGGEFIKNLNSRHKVKFISANIHYKDSGKLFAEPYTIVTLKRNSNNSGGLKKIKVGVIGLCEQRPTLFSQALEEPMLESRNPVDAAKEYLSKLRNKCDLIVLLAHMNDNVLKQVLSQVVGVDVVVLGGGYYNKQADSKQDSVIIVKTQSLGKYAGQLLLTIDQNKHIVNHTVSATSLNDKIADHPDYEALVNQAEKAEKEYTESRRKNATATTSDTKVQQTTDNKPDAQ